MFRSIADASANIVRSAMENTPPEVVKAVFDEAEPDDHRLHLELPDLPLRFEQGEQTIDGRGFFNRDVYWNESLHPDMITPYNPTEEQSKPAPPPEFKSGRS